MNCNKCGQETAPNAKICEHCGETLTQETAKPVKPENVLTGTVGAFLGAAIGVAVIVLLGRLGVIAAVSGFVLAVCTLKGYDLLGNQLTKKGILISLVLIAVAPYLADRLDWAFVIAEEWEELTLGQAFNNVHAFVEEGYIESADYIWNLLKLYFFTALGAVGTLLDTGKNKKREK